MRAGVAFGTEGSHVTLPASCVLDLCHSCCIAVSAAVGSAARLEDREREREREKREVPAQLVDRESKREKGGS